MEEIWKKIDGYENYYVSNLGRVKVVRQQILKPAYNREHLAVALYKKGCKPKRKTIHRLVAQAFLENPQNKSDVDHINGVGTDNRLQNLRWTTHQQNMRNPITFARRIKMYRSNEFSQALKNGKDCMSKPFYSINLKSGQKRLWNNQAKCGRQLQLDSRNINKILNHYKNAKTYKGYTFIFCDQL